MKILGISGSVFGTKSRIALDSLKEYFSEDTDYNIFDLSEHSIEFSDGRDYRDYKDDTKKLVSLILEADALVLASPVFQASIPGALKNVFDLLPIDSLRDKKIGIIMSAGSEKHFLVAEYQLKPILNYMKAQVIQNTVFIDANDFIDHKITSDDANMRLERLAMDLEASEIDFDF